MPAIAESLFRQVLQLPFDQRFELADRLLESVHPPGEDIRASEWHDAWMSELSARIAEPESGLPSVPAEEPWKKLDARKRAAAFS